MSVNGKLLLARQHLADAAERLDKLRGELLEAADVAAVFGAMANDFDRLRPVLVDVILAGDLGDEARAAAALRRAVHAYRTALGEALETRAAKLDKRRA